MWILNFLMSSESCKLFRVYVKLGVDDIHNILHIFHCCHGYHSASSALSDEFRRWEKRKLCSTQTCFANVTKGEGRRSEKATSENSAHVDMHGDGLDGRRREEVGVGVRKNVTFLLNLHFSGLVHVTSLPHLISLSEWVFSHVRHKMRGLFWNWGYLALMSCSSFGTVGVLFSSFLSLGEFMCIGLG